MKCPKCGYVGFDTGDRCRHCGYEFALLAEPAGPVELDLPLDASQSDTRWSAGTSVPIAATDRMVPEAATARPTNRSALGRLLVDEVEPPPAARPPLAVRRTTERARHRAPTPVARRPRAAWLEAIDEPASEPSEPGRSAAAPAENTAAPGAARALAAAIDLAVLVCIDAAIAYLTAQMAGLSMADVTTLPLVPLGLFVVGLNLAYLVVFTVHGGQTLGKMACGLRVEPLDGSISWSVALLRSALAVLGGLAIGAGFVPAMFREDGRAAHDHVTGTHVVKVTG